MRITIIRHGKPDFEWDRNVGGSEFKALESAYNSAGIVGTPPKESLDLVDQHRYVVCSDLPRSIQSAKALGANPIHFSSGVFREMNLPYFETTPIRLPLRYWAIILRGLWFFGFSKNTESLVAAKVRAGKVAEKLVELASEHHSVLFVGHGFLNHYVAKALLKNKWKGPRSPGKKYWEYGTYQQGD